MKLSIITTIYQAEKDLPRLLDSMMAQRSSELEFFLIDNGCTDGSAAICADYANRDSRFKIHTLKDNIGYIGARNLGLDIVDADYIGFCDSDDYLEPGGYDRAIEEIKLTGCQLYISDWKTHRCGKVVINRVPIMSGFYNQEQIQELIPQFWGNYNKKKTFVPAFMWKQIVSKNLVENIRFNLNLKPCEDIVFNAEVIQKTSKLKVSQNILYNYISNSSSITAKMQNDYNFADDYNRCIQLRESLITLTDKLECITANANKSLHGIRTSISNLTRHKGIIVGYKEFKKITDREYIKEFCRISRPYNFSDCILKYMLLYGGIGLLPFVMIGVLNKLR